MSARRAPRPHTPVLAARDDDAALPASERTTVPAGDAVARAQGLLAAGRAGEALAALEALDERTDDAELARVDALLALRLPREARAVTEALLERSAGLARAHLAQARALFHEGDMLRAIRAARRALELDPDDADARSRLGGMLLAAGRVRDAVGELRRALRGAAAPPRARVNLAAALLADGRGAEALHSLEALDGAPLDPASRAAALEVLDHLDSVEQQPRARALAAAFRATLVDTATTVSRPSPPPSAAPRVLAREARELVGLARAGSLERVFGRDAEVDRVIDVLLRRKKSNPLLVGPAGVGKTAVVEALAARIARGDVPPRLRNTRVYELSLASLVAGCALRGDLETKLRAVVDELRGEREAILFVDEAHTLVGAGGGGGGLDVAEVLKPALSRGEVAVIGATTEDAYEKTIARDPALARRFSVVAVTEPGPAEARAMARAIAVELGAFHGLTYAPDAVDAAVDLAVRHLPSRRLPDKAVDVLDQSGVRVVRAGRSRVELDDVRAVVAALARVPVETLASERGAVGALAEVAARMRSQVHGQEHACERVAEVLLVRRLGLGLDDARPRGVFLFVGPPGVGKTATAQALALALDGTPDALVRFDMSEVMERHDVARLIGAPAGYVGHEEGGRLVKALRARPGAVVLLDEVDKAHPEALGLFLQLFDAGRLTDGRGETVDARQAIFVMTCNVGEQGRESRVGFGAEARDGDAAAWRRREQAALSRARERLSPELLSRVDAVLYFGPLSTEALRAIARSQLERAAGALAGQGATLRIEDDVAERLVVEADTREHGARAIARCIERRVLLPAARLALVTPPPLVLTVRVRDGEVEVA